MNLSDLEWYSKIFNDAKRRAVSLRQLSFWFRHTVVVQSFKSAGNFGLTASLMVRISNTMSHWMTNAKSFVKRQLNLSRRFRTIHPGDQSSNDSHSARRNISTLRIATRRQKMSIEWCKQSWTLCFSCGRSLWKTRNRRTKSEKTDSLQCYSFYRDI